MNIPQNYFKNDSVYGNLSDNPRNGTIGCGFLLNRTPLTASLSALITTGPSIC